MRGFQQIPEQHRETIARAIKVRYPESVARADAGGFWDALLGVYFFTPYPGRELVLGVEKDGYIHS